MHYAPALRKEELYAIIETSVQTVIPRAPGCSLNTDSVLFAKQYPYIAVFENYPDQPGKNGSPRLYIILDYLQANAKGGYKWYSKIINEKIRLVISVQDRRDAVMLKMADLGGLVIDTEEYILGEDV